MFIAGVRLLSRAKEVFIILSAGIMEYCWFAAVVMFFFHIMEAGEPPLAGMLIAFFLSAALGSFMMDRGWMFIQFIGAHLSGLSLVLAIVFFTYGNWSYGFFNTGWLREFGAEFQDPAKGLLFFFIAAFTALIWFCGERFSLRPTTYSTITTRFDLGVAVFFLLFLFGGGLGEQIPVLSFFLFPFFLFSMLAIALAHSRGREEDRPSPASGKIWVVFGLCGALLLSAVAVLLFLIPEMTMLAEIGYSAGSVIASPVLTLLIRILRFLFGMRSMVEDSADSGSGSYAQLMTDTYSDPEVQWWEKLLFTGIGSLIGVAVILAAAWGLYLLFRRLFSRSPSYNKNSMTWRHLFGFLRDQLLMFCRKAGGIFSLCYAKLFPAPEEAGEGTIGYRKLLHWGKTGGLLRRPAETPGEYGIRLGSFYPLFKEDIDLIVEGYQQEVYGEYRLEAGQGDRIRRARRRLSAPWRRLSLKTKRQKSGIRIL